MKMREIVEVARESAVDFADDGAFRLAAALAYYAMLSIAPLLLLVLTLVGTVFGREHVANEIIAQMRVLVGEAGAEVAQTVLTSASGTDKSGWGALVGVLVLVFGASGVFLQLQDSMNVIWEVTREAKAGWREFLKKRFLSVGMLLGIAFLLMVSLVVSAALAAASRYFSETWPGALAFWWGLDLLLPTAIYWPLFALLFKYLPDTQIPWRDVWIGSLITALLFSIGKMLIGLYLGRGTVASAYGAAGSVVALLVWVYYSSVILLFGAEVTQTISRRWGSRSDVSRETSYREHAPDATPDARINTVSPPINRPIRSLP